MGTASPSTTVRSDHVRPAMAVTAGESQGATALVTGASGFVGRHLVTALLADGYRVVGSSRQPPPKDTSLDDWVQGDLLDGQFVTSLVRRAQPTHVFHLAGALGADAGQRRALLELHLLATAGLLEALAAEFPAAWICVAGSSAIYGPGLEQPIRERSRPMPLTDYAVSKAAQELVAGQFRRACRLDCCVLRLFNLIGPGLSERLLISGLARQVAVQEHEGPGVVYVGNLEPRRDFLDVRDAVRAIVQLGSLRCREEAVNIGSGRSWSVGHCVDLLLAAARRPLRVEVDPARLRAHDIAEQRADITLLRELTGWSPRLDLATSIQDGLEHWRHALGQRAAGA